MKKYSQILETKENIETLASINLNDVIYVKLSKDGEKFFRKKYVENCVQAKIPLANTKEMLEKLRHGDYWEFQFWYFIDYYNEYSKQANNSFVADLNIFLSKITQRGERTAKNTGII